jgi:hypothetical protein
MDIDIDLLPSFDPKTIFPEVVLGSNIKNNQLVKHNCGVYFQNIPIDSITNISAIPHREATKLGYFKVDFLSLTVLEHFKSKSELRELMNQEPNWELLEDEQIVSSLSQINKQYNIINKIKPKSVQELADVIAIVRPTKRHYLTQYIQNKNAIRPLLYRSEQEDKSSFKRGHAIAYALTIVAELNLIERSLNNL